MKRVSKSLLVAAVAALAVSCAASTEMIGVWSDPAYQALPTHKVLVIGLGQNEGMVKLFEGEMAKAFGEHKITVVPGSSVFAVGQPIDTTIGRQYCRDNGIDLVSVTRVVGISKESEYVPGDMYYAPAPSYYGFYPYYYSSYSMVSTPGYMREYKVATVETNVYQISTEKLAWSGQSKTMDPSSINSAMTDISLLLVNEMDRSGLFAADKKKK